MVVYLQDVAGESSPLVIDSFLSFRWREKYSDIGEFELHIPNTTQALRMAMQDDMSVWFKRSRGRGLVERVVVKRDSIILSGRMESGRMKKKVAGKVRYTGKPSDIMGQLWETLGGGYAIVEPDPNPSTTVITAYGDVSSYVVGLAKSYNIGFYAGADTLNIYYGVDRSIDQETRRQVVFTESDLDSPVWTYDRTNYYDSAVVVGADSVVTVGSGDLEIYVDALHVEKGDSTTAEYTAGLSEQGTAALAEHPLVDNFEAAVALGSSWVYGKDYDLGDIVSVQAWGRTLSYRITEVESVWENGIKTIYPVFGNPEPERLMR